ncbi:MAG: PolC-type DNA polymerase III, partial [Clostridia bacterium]|nr:PolC-type DNA polymerase III [Clostridia bacterium]
VAVSRYINAGQAKHTLDTLAVYFGLGDFDHHRADADTEMLAMIFACLLQKLTANGIADTDAMIAAMAERADPRKIKRVNHILILAQNETGLKNLYRLVSLSYLNYFGKKPRIPLTVLREYREGLLLGTACAEGELYQAVMDGQPFDRLCAIARKYDFLEVQPWTNNWFLFEEGHLGEDPEAAREMLRGFDRTIVRIGEETGIPVCATGDVHFLDPEDEIFRQILMAGQKFPDADRETKLYLKTADEMLEAFSFLGEEKAREIVLDNPRAIADRVSFLLPIPKGQYTPSIPGAQEDLIAMCRKTATEMYGDPLPEIVKNRMDREIQAVIKYHYAVLYVIARNLVRNSEENGYYVGSRGSVGSSFVATLARISEVNPLPPHYRCPKCKHSEFITDGSVGSGFDMPDKDCPECGAKMTVDGHDIPFETFLGFEGEKAPDIDLNFSGDVQTAAHKYTEVLFGKENIFRAGTVGTLQSKTCFGFVKHYLEDRNIALTKAETERLIDGCLGVKRTTGQHPGGIVVIPKEHEIYDFTPVQHPADKEESGVVTTHFAFDYLHDTLLKLDSLGHDVPTFYRILEEYTGKSVMSLPMNDPNVYELFKSTKPLKVRPSDIGCEIGTLGLPEFGTKYAIQMILDAKPQNFSDLLQISGLSHGTGIWLGNGKDLIANGTCSIHEIIGTRDSIMLYLMQRGLKPSVAFEAMERTRKGKGLTKEIVDEMKTCGVPDWYMDSCNKIKYMFPKAHAAAYTIASLRIAWFKVYMPVAFYATYFTVKSDTFDGGLVMKGESAIRNRLKELQAKDGTTAKEEDMMVILNLVLEMYARKIVFLPVRITKSDATRFLPEGDAVRLPFSSLQGLGEKAAGRIFDAVRSGRATTVEELISEPGVGRSAVEVLRAHGCLEGLPESNQYTLF